jgi:membrane-bound serine protease (ClpP class)
MRSIMRATAEENGRDPRIAEGMVDEKVVVDSIKQAGKVITFTTTEAIANGYCEGKVESIEEILKKNNISNYTLERFKLGATERIIAISGLLILIIIGGIYFELQTPGIGFPLFAAIIALVLYLVPYYLNGLAEYWEILALFVGIVLIILELFVIPGFGVAGVAGIALTITSLVLIMLNNDFFNFDFVPLGDIVVALFAAVGGLTGGVMLLFVAGPKLTRTQAFRNIALTDTQEKEQGYTSNLFPSDIVGQRGEAYTVLRPGGKVMIAGNIFDAYTRGEFVDRGEPIEVLAAEGTSLRVKKSV